MTGELSDKKLEMVTELEASTRSMAEQDYELKDDAQDVVEIEAPG